MKNIITKICKDSNNIIIFSLLMIAFFISIIPTLNLLAINYGHDLNAHTLMIDGMKLAIEYRDFPLYINYVSNNFTGDCSFIVYPYIFKYIPAIIYYFCLDINVSINIFIIIIQLFTIIITFYSTYIITKDKIVSINTTIFWLLFYYRLYNIFDRAAMGEYTALVFIPLFVSSVYNIFFDDKKKWYLLPLSLTFLIQSHVLTAFYIIILFLVFCIVLIVRIIKNKKILFILIKSALIVLLLNLWTLVPLIQYYLEQKVGTVLLGVDFMYFPHDITNVFLLNVDSIPIYNSFGLESLIAYIVIVIVLIRTIYLCRKNGSWKDNLLYFVMVAISFYYLIASVGFFNLDIFYSNPLIHYIFSKQQWLYREIGRGGFFVAIAFAMSINKINTKQWLKVLIVLIIASSLSLPYVINRCFGVNNVKISTDSLMDYLPIIDGADYYNDIVSFGSKTDLIENDSDKVNIENNDYFLGSNSNNVIIKDEKFGYGQWIYEYEKTDDNIGYINIPINSFTGYVVRDENNNIVPHSENINKQIQLTVDKKEGKFTIRFEPPLHWVIANIISLITLILIIAYKELCEIKQLKQIKYDY